MREGTLGLWPGKAYLPSPPQTHTLFTRINAGGGSFIYRNDNRKPGEAPQKQGSSLLLSSLKKKKKKKEEGRKRQKEK